MSTYTQSGAVAVIAFDDGKANVVDHDFIASMNSGLDRAQRDAGAIVITGRSGMFSGGFDLNELKRGPDAAQALVGAGARMLLRLFQHPQPIVAAVSGHAIAAGAFILLASDTRWAADGDFKFGLNETAIGFALPVFGLQLAAARLSQPCLSQALTQATIYDTAGALEVGFIDRILPPAALLEASIAEAARLGEFDAEAYAANKMGWRAPYAAAIAKSLAS